VQRASEMGFSPGCRLSVGGVSLRDDQVAALQAGRVGDPFGLLGLHRGEDGQLWARIWQRGASELQLRARDDGSTWPLQRRVDGLFEAPIPREQAFPYEVLVRSEWDTEQRVLRDPYAFWPQLPDWDLDRFREGRHHHLEELLGARPCAIDGCAGTLFAVWAPAAERVSVVGDWNGFEGRWHPMRRRHRYGVWELFLPGVGPGARYKYEVLGCDAELRVKADPMALHCEQPPATASIVAHLPAHDWRDADWLRAREATDWRAAPMAIYEVHVGSWRRGAGDRYLSYRELAEPLAEHCRRHGFTHVEFLPLAAHPYEGSWGYQVSGWWAPNARHGDHDDLCYLVDVLHQSGIGVIVDFVPGHFPKDAFALADFDGDACYEYGNVLEGEHREWGTKVFNWRRSEVRNFLIGSALYWLRHFHVDGLRVDAVSSMLYRDYGRERGEWVANEQGGNENWEAVSFLQELNAQVHEQFPSAITVAEESTAWAGVTRPTSEQGLGSDMKWNMGWMHDSLAYLGVDPVHRSAQHDRITFHQWYAYDERWVLPLSHDEVVHGKRSLLDKMPGDYHQRLCQLRLLFCWQAFVPGRPLVFQGGEFGQGREWDWQRSLDWHEAEAPERAGIGTLLADALGLYRGESALHAADEQRSGFQWLDVENRAESVLAFLRLAPDAPPALVVCNFTPVPRGHYQLGAPQGGAWRVRLNSDERRYGGGGDGPVAGADITADAAADDPWPATLQLDLPPLSCVVLMPA